MKPPASAPSALLYRDLGALAFNARVLDMARRPEVPLLERLRYLTIVSSNLDEFFEIRVSDTLDELRLANPGNEAIAAAAMREISLTAHALVDDQYELYNDQLTTDFKKAGLQILSHGERNAAQRRWVAAFFAREVRPLLVPVSLDPAHPFPQVANKSLHFIVRLSGRDAFGRQNDIAIVRVPRALPRVIKLPDELTGRRQGFVLLSSVLRASLNELFPGRHVEGFSQFRVTRDSDLAVDELEVTNLRQALRLELTQRQFGRAVRLEVATSCPESLSTFLLEQFQLSEQALYRVDGPVNLVRLAQLIDLVPAKALHYPPHTPAWPASVPVEESMFERLRHGDVLLHHPFESFDPVEALLREAVQDPQVLSIQQTIYRTSADSALMELLLEATRRGKEVMVVVELKARFDEEANINWAERLEALGAQVVYGIVGLKTHAKMLLITRREGRQLRRYGHLSTGNYNPRTARLYTDIGHLTANSQITADMAQVFQHLASQSRMSGLKALIVAPFTLHSRMMEHVQAATAAARAGTAARIVLKMNALTDEALALALAEAGCAGVSVDLIVRGACVVPAGRKGFSDNVRVRSIIGRFLEHSRVFYFRVGSDEKLYLSSADWMGRNMFRRIELAWPVDDPAFRQRLIDETLTAYLHDERGAWQMMPDGHYERVPQLRGKSGRSAQQALAERYNGLPR
ncbi:MAG TPA: polyphosphate kinase 1 [Burkholderiaceae bacterium]|nr:polyphosphate kinase 1 [Burkholderiaceae bacterium]